MKETSTIGFEYIAEKMHEQQLQLDSAFPVCVEKHCLINFVPNGR